MFFVVLILINCKDPVDLKTRETSGQLVVDGRINTQPGPYVLNLGRTIGINQKPVPEVGAQVIIYDDAGNAETYQDRANGTYTLPGNIVKGVAGRSYHIEVRLSNDELYVSDPQKIPEDTGTDVPYYDFGTRSDFIGETEVTNNVINVMVNTQLPASTTVRYFKWDVTDTYMFEPTPIFNPLIGRIPNPCYVEGIPDGQRITVYSTRNQTTTSLAGTLVAQRDIDHTFLARHYFTIYMSSITKESYDYWSHVDQLINRSGSIFDTPPAPIRGNIRRATDEKEEVFGIFEVANTSLSRFFVIRENVPYAIQPYCNDPTKGVYWPLYPAECFACTRLPNSSMIPPYWWK